MRWAHPDWLSCTVDYFMELIIMRKFDPILLERLFKSARGKHCKRCTKICHHHCLVLITVQCTNHVPRIDITAVATFLHSTFVCFFLLKVNRSVPCESLMATAWGTESYRQCQRQLQKGDWRPQRSHDQRCNLLTAPLRSAPLCTVGLSAVSSHLGTAFIL